MSQEEKARILERYANHETIYAISQSLGRGYSHIKKMIRVAQTKAAKEQSNKVVCIAENRDTREDIHGEVKAA
jgi:predicted oxidoreductase (fatty acid repression mutant protein)